MDGSPKKLILQFQNINKSFSGVQVLKDVSFGITSGEVHALLGENGAGKSTLMKILSGAYQRDSGQVLLDGSTVEIANPKDAERMGIAIIYQELNLIPEISVAENIFLNRQPKAGPAIDWKQMNSAAQKILDSMEVAIPAKAMVGQLRVAQQQMVEIAKAVSLNSRILVMDEPTSSLSEGEAQKLFKVIETLKQKGITIIYISHRMDEVFQICDSFTVMRDGAFIQSGAIAQTNLEQIVEYMVGRTLSQVYPEKTNKIGEKVLEVENLSDRHKVDGVSFTLHRGEILGFGGLMGAGRTETMRLLFGADRKTRGTITINGKPVQILEPTQAIRYGIGLLPEDRKQEGLVTELPVVDNILMAKMETAFHRKVFSAAKAKKICERYISELNIKTPSHRKPAKYLSGGNQQKVVLAKWLNRAPEIIVLDEPTRGIDINAKMEIYQIIVRLAEQGKAIILISSELPELIGLCDRIIVMRDGKMSGELSRENMTQNEIMLLATGGK